VQIATAAGANVIGVDIDSDKLEAARRQGAVATVNAAEDAPAAIRDLTRGKAEVAVDALGVTKTCRNSIMSLRKRGRHLQIGLTGAAEHGDIAVPIDLIVTNELTLIGSALYGSATLWRHAEAGRAYEDDAGRAVRAGIKLAKQSGD
jgi:threonine dehydrogenase-like Zn-dependent dehydrogenase